MCQTIFKHILISYEVRRQNSWKNLKNYKQLIDESLVTKNKEQFLKKCDEFTEEVIKKDILPEDVVDLHKTYIASLNLKTSQILDTLDVLEEVVKGFGYSYRDYQNLVDKMQFHDKEIDLASRLQQTMLKQTFHSLIVYK